MLGRGRCKVFGWFCIRHQGAREARGKAVHACSIRAPTPSSKHLAPWHKALCEIFAAQKASPARIQPSQRSLPLGSRAARESKGAFCFQRIERESAKSADALFWARSRQAPATWVHPILEVGRKSFICLDCSNALHVQTWLNERPGRSTNRTRALSQTLSSRCPFFPFDRLSEIPGQLGV